MQSLVYNRATSERVASVRVAIKVHTAVVSLLPSVAR